LVDARRLLAVSPDGLTAAYASAWVGPGSLSVVRAAGKTTTFELGAAAEIAPGAAAFAPDSSWLAVVDGAGDLWRIDLGNDSATRLKTPEIGGVFGRWLRFDGSDRLIVNIVRSTAVPLPTNVATLDLQTMSVDLLTNEGWAWGGWPQFDGSLVYVTILPEGGPLQLNSRAKDGTVVVGADIGITTWIDVNDSGFVAYANLDGEVLLRAPAGEIVSLGPGAIPRFAPDGAHIALVAEMDTKVRSFDLTGAVTGEVPGVYASWAICGGACSP
jgi:hypothetical protein